MVGYQELELQPRNMGGPGSKLSEGKFETKTTLAKENGKGLAYVDSMQEQVVPKVQEEEKVCSMKTRPPKTVFKTTKLPKTPSRNPSSIKEYHGTMALDGVFGT